MSDHRNDHSDKAGNALLETVHLGDFAAFGVGQVAYIKPITIDGNAAFAVHAANGQPLTAVVQRSLAEAIVRQHDMEPVSLH